MFLLCYSKVRKSPLNGCLFGTSQKVASARVPFHFISLKCESVLYTGCRELSDSNRCSLYDGCMSLHCAKVQKYFLNALNFVEYELMFGS